MKEKMLIRRMTRSWPFKVATLSDIRQLDLDAGAAADRAAAKVEGGPRILNIKGR